MRRPVLAVLTPVLAGSIAGAIAAPTISAAGTPAAVIGKKSTVGSSTPTTPTAQVAMKPAGRRWN